MHMFGHKGHKVLLHDNMLTFNFICLEKLEYLEVLHFSLTYHYPNIPYC